jgi:hypothetical protein
MKETRGKEAAGLVSGGQFTPFDVQVRGPRGANLQLPGGPAEGGEDPLRHDPNADRTFSPTEVVFNGHVLLPGPEQPRFLAWDDRVAGKPIVSAVYHHGTITPSGQLVDSGRRLEVSSDPGREIWFIPLADLVEGDPANANPMVEHRIRVELFLGDSEVRVFLVRLKLVGRIEGVTLRSAFSIDDVRDELANASARPLRVWVRGRPELLLETSVAVARHSPGVREEVVVREEREIARARLAVVGAETELAAAAPTAGGWWEFLLPARSRIAIRWRLTAENGVRCAFPTEPEQVFAWDCGEYRCRPGRGDGSDCEWRSRRCENRRTDSWHVSGLRLSGAWRRDVFVADAALSFPDPSHGGGFVQQLESAEGRGPFTQVDVSSGAPFDPAVPSHACSGVFF